MDSSETPLEEIMKEERKKKKEQRANLKHKQIKANRKIVQDILETKRIPPKFHEDEPCSLETVEPNSQLGTEVMSMFRIRKFNDNYKINKIAKVHNPYLLAQYELMKTEKKMSEKRLYHGTKMEHLDSICTYNFDWRHVKKGKYGFGVSFANNPYFASHFSIRDRRSDEDYVMILAKVLIGEKYLGRPNLTCPKEGFDTTTNEDGQVLVKYDDCTFYPEFIIYFEDK